MRELMTSSSRFAERSGYKIVGLSGRRAAPADWAAAAREAVGVAAVATALDSVRDFLSLRKRSSA